MPDIKRRNRVAISNLVDIDLDEADYIDTSGDRRRGLNTRRPARIVGYHLEFAWVGSLFRWNLLEAQSQILVQQQRSNGTWGPVQHRTISYDAGPRLESQYAPTSNPVVTW